MKKGILLFTIISCICTASFAQTTLEIIPQAGYTFADKVNFNSTFGRINEGFNYGGSLQFNMNRHIGIEFMYNRMDVPAQLYNYGAIPGDAPIYQTNAGINYVMAGPVTSFPLPNSPANLFFGVDLGAAFFSPSPQDFSSDVKFAYGFQFGTNIYLNPNVGIRLSGRLLGVAPTSGYYFGGWGYPAGGYYNYYGGIVQFGFNLGLIIGLGQVLPVYQKAQRAPHYHAPRKYYYY
jgi:hypothetical protein